MAITFRCACGRIITADAKYAGLKVKCPQCAAPVQVPTSEFEILPPPQPSQASFGSPERDAKAIRRGRFDATTGKPIGAPPGRIPTPMRRLRKAAGGRRHQRR